MNGSIDAYCERIGAGFWAEPINALTNFAFFVAAFLAWRFQRKQHGRNGRYFTILLVLVILLGWGSFLFHTLATSWAKVADMLPIALFAVYYGIVALKQIVGWGRQRIVISLILFLLSLVATITLIPEDQLNGSAVYLPFVVLFVAFASLLQIRQQVMAAHYLWAVTIIFSTALFLRTIDLAVCAVWPLGTHFLWHLLLAVMVYLLLRLITRSFPMDVPRNANGRFSPVDATPEQR